MKFQTVIYSSAGDLADLRQHSLPAASIAELDDWKKSPDLALKELKFLDRQMVLLFRVVSRLFAKVPDFNHLDGGVQVAVGPGRTDIEALLSWAKRIQEAETFPTIQPALAVSLLHNTPLSWLSIKLRLTGDCGIWSGFSEAGFAAIEAAFLALCSGIPEVLVAAVNSPRNYFVETTLKRGLFPNVHPPVEIGVAQIFRREGPGPELHALRVFPPESDLETIAATSVKSLARSVPDPWPRAIIEGFQQRFDVAKIVGDSMPCAMPLAIALAGEGFFGPGFHPVFVAAPDGHILYALVEARHV